MNPNEEKKSDSTETTARGGRGLAAASCSAVKCWGRHTIMQGWVATYAIDFTGSGKFPEGKDATGHFEVSASRDCVYVHRAQIQTDWQLQTFKSAVEEANRMHCILAICDGRPGWDQPNAKVTHDPLGGRCV